MNILITGSSHGIGTHTAFRFAEEGHTIIITYHRASQEAEKVAERCRELGAKAHVFALDLMDDSSIESFSKKIRESFDSIVLINNAGVAVRKHLADQEFSDIERQLRTNLEGLIKLTLLLDDVSDTIINIASGASKTGYSNLSVYCATKFGLRGFTDALRKERQGVFLVNPGTTATRMSDFRGDPPEKVADVIFDTFRHKKSWEVNVWDY